jgi:tetratricopeptide (TPR) repeat protein
VIRIQSWCLALIAASMLQLYAGAEAEPAPRLFEGLGKHTRKVSTASAEAQTYFNQGLNWAFSFNHDEAIKSFQHAAKLDPRCAMAHWGAALVNGPHINAPLMDEPHSKAAWEALQLARKNIDSASPVEAALINALSKRYVDPAAPPGGKLPLTFEERKDLDKAYADAMAKVYAEFPDDADVATLYAEALMDLRPWDLHEVGTLKPRPETGPALAALEKALALNPDHPGANHYYVHAAEASATPEKANAAAERLRTLVPASGHMIHMPSHIDARTGRWAQAAEQNRLANAVDTKYRELSPKQGAYRLYMAHDDHFLAYACMMLGRREEALNAARDMVRKIPPEFIKEMAVFVDAYTPITSEVMVRFGMWDEILASEEPPEYLPATRALWNFAKATALTAKGDLAKAEAARQEFKAAVTAVPKNHMLAQNPAHQVLEIASHTLDGEMAFRAGKIDDAVASLSKAVEIEDTLRYIEPPDWVQPVRHSLGAVLLAANRPKDAEKVYREDLARLPENGWSLYGLSQALKSQNSPETAAVEARFKKAWEHADTKIKATCLCVDR